MEPLSPAVPFRHYSHLSLGERHQIHALKAAGWSARAIAAHLGRSPATVIVELGRCPHGYDPDAAHQAAVLAREPSNGREWVMDSPAGRLLVPELLTLMGKARRSVTQALTILGQGTTTVAHLAREVSASVVYRWIKANRGTHPDAMRLNQYLIRPNRRPGAAPPPRSTIPGLVPVAERPAEAADRSVPGHWEGDLIFGKQSKTVLLTLVDRCTRVTRILAPGSKTSLDVLTVLTAWAQATTDPVKTITWDRGSEMYEHRQFTTLTGVPVYFCEPHSPWQRPSNENTNGVIRRFHPKGTPLDTSPGSIAFIEHCLNTRPMPALSGATPEQALTYHTSR